MVSLVAEQNIDCVDINLTSVEWSVVVCILYHSTLSVNYIKYFATFFPFHV